MNREKFIVAVQTFECSGHKEFKYNNVFVHRSITGNVYTYVGRPFVESK
jgi:hypothetical protein